MLVKKCKDSSGFFQIQNGKLLYLDPKSNDRFEIDTKMVQALNIKELETGKNTCQLEIVGNYQILKSIQLPTKFAQDVKYWIYLHLHFLGAKGSQNIVHKDVQSKEIIQYRKKQKLRATFLTLVISIILVGLFQTISRSYQISKLKAEAKSATYSEWMEESKKSMQQEEFNDGIHKLLLANVIKPSPVVRGLLDDAYLIRGKYYLSVENVPLAKKDFSHIQGLKQETAPLIARINQYEKGKWLRFKDFTELIQFAWSTLIYNLDHGQNEERSRELSRTWLEFQSKLTYTRNYHPIFQETKDFFLATVY